MVVKIVDVLDEEWFGVVKAADRQQISG